MFTGVPTISVHCAKYCWIYMISRDPTLRSRYCCFNLQMKKQTSISQPSQGHTTIKGFVWNTNPGALTAAPRFNHHTIK